MNPTSTEGIALAPANDVWSKLRMRMMGLGDRDVAPLLRFFEPAEPAARERLTRVVYSFVEGYNHAIASNNTQQLASALDKHDPERSGFAWEGAGMGVALKTLLFLGNHAFGDYLRAADKHHYIVHIGAGWAMARIGIRHGALKKQMCPVYHWLAWDGYGFHETMFKPERTLEQGRGRPTHGFAGNAFDQGVGRALWFAAAARPAEVHRYIQGLAPERHEDLWGGVGLAITYAGGVSDETLQAVVQASGKHRAALAVGSALAVHTRHRTGNATAHTANASRLVTGVSDTEIPPLVRAMENELGSGDEVYPQLRRRLQAHFQQKS